MAETSKQALQALVVEDELDFTLNELCRVCRAERLHVIALVEEGVLTPQGASPDDWLFAGPALRRARAALRLHRDFELNAPGTALVLDLLDEIAQLRSRLARGGIR